MLGKKKVGEALQILKVVQVYIVRFYFVLISGYICVNHKVNQP